MSRIIKQKTISMIKQAEHILLLTDERIDGDTIGSTLGMYHVLKEVGKRVTVFSPEPLAKSLAFLPGTEAIKRNKAIFDHNDFDLVLVFDCSDGEYFKPHLPNLKRRIPLIVFDHHASNPGYGTINFIEEHAASTADVVWRFVKEAGFDVTKDAAQCFLTGICTDTNVFQTANTTPEAFQAAKELITLGARLDTITKNTMMNKPVETLRLWGIAFERLHHHKELDLLATAVTQKDIKKHKVKETEASLLSEFLHAMVEGADTVLVLRERDDGSVKGSFRSKSRDVKALAEKFGGGGHKKASGFKVPDAHLECIDNRWVVVKKDGTVVL